MIKKKASEQDILWGNLQRLHCLLLFERSVLSLVRGLALPTPVIGGPCSQQKR